MYRMDESDHRIPLDACSDKVKESFVICDEYGLNKVQGLELKGTGGSALVYLGTLNGIRGCVVKEFYPYEEQWGAKFDYIRDKATGEIILCPRSKNVEEKKRQLLEEELAKQRSEIEAEIQMMDRVFCADGYHNSNHVLPQLYLTQKGDTHYVVLDTREGKTLYDKVKDAQDGHMGIQAAMEDALALFEMVHTMFDGKYCHGDIKPENIWCGNSEGADERIENKYFLDFGSVFSLEEYQNADYEELEKEELLKLAGKISANAGIACSSENYRSIEMQELRAAKNSFLDDPFSVKRAVRLVKKINQIDVSTDVYAVVKVFYFMLLGEDYRSMDAPSTEELAERLGVEQDIAELILEMMKKNGNGKYRTIDQAVEDLKIIQAMLEKEAVPQVLISGIKKDVERMKESFDYREVDEGLFCEVKRENMSM